MKCNDGINCNVEKCMHNVDKKLCDLDCIQVSYNCECGGDKSACTCCASYEEK